MILMKENKRYYKLSRGSFSPKSLNSITISFYGEPVLVSKNMERIIRIRTKKENKRRI